MVVDARAEPSTPDLVPLVEPRDGLPTVITSSAELAVAAQQLHEGHGPVALDAERASGHRYGQRAYLIQLRRAGAGTFLIDPVAQPDLAVIDAALTDVEWVLHAASQDLACLEEVGLHPRAGLFDTELAARILGRARVGLGPLVADVLGFSLAKEHSAVDWSTRPLRRSWLVYAALDVEVLLELAEALRAELADADKTDVLAQECAHVIRQSQIDALPKPDPWRRTSGLHKVRGRRGLAVVQSLWTERDQIARIHDVHPSRVLPDAALIAAAIALPRTFDDLDTLPEFGSNAARRNQRTWWRAIRTASSMAELDLPATSGPSDAPPPPRTWAGRNPAAWARLEAARAAVALLADLHTMPVENLVKPDLLRRICWQPPDDVSDHAVAQALAQGGARPWQIALVAPAVAQAWRSPTFTESAESASTEAATTSGARAGRARGASEPTADTNRTNGNPTSPEAIRRPRSPRLRRRPASPDTTR